MHCKTMLSLSQILLFQGLKASATYLYQNVYRIRPLPPPPHATDSWRGTVE